MRLTVFPDGISYHTLLPETRMACFEASALVTVLWYAVKSPEDTPAMFSVTRFVLSVRVALPVTSRFRTLVPDSKLSPTALGIARLACFELIKLNNVWYSSLSSFITFAISSKFQSVEKCGGGPSQRGNGGRYFRSHLASRGPFPQVHAYGARVCLQRKIAVQRR